MAITMEKIDQVADQISAIQEKTSKLNELIVKVQTAILSDEEGNPEIDLTAGQKQALLGKYKVVKQELIEAVKDLL